MGTPRTPRLARVAVLGTGWPGWSWVVWAVCAHSVWGARGRKRRGGRWGLARFIYKNDIRVRLMGLLRAFGAHAKACLGQCLARINPSTLVRL